MDARAVYIVNTPILWGMILYIMLSAIARNASGSLMLRNIIMWNLNKKYKLFPAKKCIWK